jgi:TolB-like protein/Flp pilus assembly protein TadD
MPFSDEMILRQLNRIIDSAAFRNAGRLRAFLRFVVEQTLAGQQDQIKEYSIAVAVCGRPGSFDPKADPIVRVDATRLRSRLATYYETEGVDDEIRIELPKGRYVPAFSRAPSSSVPVQKRRYALAVLPFVNLGVAGEQDDLVDSLTEDLIQSLAKIDRLNVIARSSVFQFKSRFTGSSEIGRRLQVDHVLEGTVRVAGTRMRITAQLIEVLHGWLVWSEKYECVWDEVFSVQDQIVASITDVLKIGTTAESGPTVFEHVTDDPEAYRDYLRGRHHWNQRTAEALSVSLRWYEQALARDPGCAAAYSGIADTLTVMALNDQEPTLTVMPRARSSARKALELRPGWPEALASLGCVKSIFDWDWEGGARDFADSIARQPGSARAHYLYGIVNLAPCGLWEHAIAEMHAALTLDPVSPVLFRDLGLIHFMRGDGDAAERAWSQAEELASSFHGCLFWRARMAIAAGKSEEAISVLERRINAAPANTRVLATIAYAWARHGNEERARSILEDLTARAGNSRVPPLDFATVWLGLEETEQALTWLERACEERAAPLYHFAVDPIYDPIRAHPRAEAIRLAMGLPLITRR